jgi:hypothetical protein
MGTPHCAAYGDGVTSEMPPGLHTSTLTNTVLDDQSQYRPAGNLTCFRSPSLTSVSRDTLVTLFRWGSYLGG